MIDIKAKIKEIRAKGIKQSIRDWRSERHWNENAWWDVLSYDPINKRYRLDRTTIKERDVPEYSLMVTGDTHHYLTCAYDRPKREIKREDGTYRLNAIALYLFYKDNSILDALTSVWKTKRIDTRALVIAGLAVAIGAYVLVSMGVI